MRLDNPLSAHGPSLPPGDGVPYDAGVVPSTLASADPLAAPEALALRDSADVAAELRGISHQAAAHGIAPVRRGHPAYQYMRDADGGGVVCE